MPGLKDGLSGGHGRATSDNIRSEFQENLIIDTNKKIYFRDTGISISSPEDGVLVMASDGTGESIRFDLSTKSASNFVSVRDSDTFPVTRLDAAGNVKAKGIVGRTATSRNG